MCPTGPTGTTECFGGGGEGGRGLVYVACTCERDLNNPIVISYSYWALMLGSSLPLLRKAY